MAKMPAPVIGMSLLLLVACGEDPRTSNVPAASQSSRLVDTELADMSPQTERVEAEAQENERRRLADFFRSRRIPAKLTIGATREQLLEISGTKAALDSVFEILLQDHRYTGNRLYRDLQSGPLLHFETIVLRYSDAPYVEIFSTNKGQTRPTDSEGNRLASNPHDSAQAALARDFTDAVVDRAPDFRAYVSGDTLWFHSGNSALLRQLWQMIANDQPDSISLDWRMKVHRSRLHYIAVASSPGEATVYTMAGGVETVFADASRQKAYDDYWDAVGRSTELKQQQNAKIDDWVRSGAISLEDGIRMRNGVSSGIYDPTTREAVARAVQEICAKTDNDSRAKCLVLRNAK